MKLNFYRALLLFTSSFLVASCEEGRSNCLTAPIVTDLKTQVIAFIKEDDQKEQDRLQKIKDDRTRLLLTSAQTLDNLSRAHLKKVRTELQVLEKNEENDSILKELEVIKQQHRRRLFLFSRSVSASTLQNEASNLKSAIKVVLSKEVHGYGTPLAPVVAEEQK